MKKYTSVASLAMKLSWLRTVVIFATAGAIQFLVARSWLMPGGVPLSFPQAFEAIADTVMVYGCIGFLALVLALIFTGMEFKKSRHLYTLRRLGISEARVTAVFGAVFSGYLFLYWAYELAIVFGLFRWYAAIYAPGENILMLAAWRSDWFHYLLPLQEWMGYVRNIILCLSCGFCAALGAHQMRHGRAYIPALVPLVIAALGLSAVTPGMLVVDIVMSVSLAASAIGCALFVKGGSKNEDIL